MTCDPATLAQDARCVFDCIPGGFQPSIRTSLLCFWANNLIPPGDRFRITDLGDFRVTDTGDNRIWTT